MILNTIQPAMAKAQTRRTLTLAILPIRGRSSLAEGHSAQCAAAVKPRVFLATGRCTPVPAPSTVPSRRCFANTLKYSRVVPHYRRNPLLRLDDYYNKIAFATVTFTMGRHRWSSIRILRLAKSQPCQTCLTRPDQSSSN